MSIYEIEHLVLEYLENYPRSSIEEIANGIGYSYSAIYKLVEGRKNSRSLVGLVNTGVIKALPGINCDTGRLVWCYELVV
ncbi:MAG: hypothetical protein P4M12_10585 [Gammaproteobacteria bacterium]|nr:hypothetical protein [Gammaproteobacteria bacterium]